MYRPPSARQVDFIVGELSRLATMRPLPLQKWRFGMTATLGNSDRRNPGRREFRTGKPRLPEAKIGSKQPPVFVPATLNEAIRHG